MHFLKLLKRSGATLEDLLCLYTSVSRPILEYACQVWHSSLTTAQTEALEYLQRKALRIIMHRHGDHGDYLSQLSLTGLDSLQEWRETLTEKFYVQNVLDSESCVHYLLPAKRDTAVTSK